MSWKLVDLLLQQELLDDVKTEEIRRISKESKHTEEYIVLNEEYIDENKLFSIMKNYYKIPYIDLDFVEIKKEAINVISKELAMQHEVVPFDIEGDKLHIAFVDPLDCKSIEELSFFTNKNIIVYISKKEQVISVIEKYYIGNLAEKVAQQLKEECEADEVLEKRVLYKDDKTQKSPTVQLTDFIIHQAINKRASDIHIEPFENVVIVRFRIDGELNEIMNLQRKGYDSLISRIKFMANMNIAQKLKPLDGKFSLKIDGTNYDFRVSSLPTVYGEKIVIRILHKNNRLISLDLLGFHDESNIILRNMVKHSQGIILATGPTGSGKSTTLYALLNEIDRQKRNIVTIEDPVEYSMLGINQVSVNNKSGLTFATGLRSVLRQDPDVIMIGEIRDEETAQIAVRAAITGHLVLSTLHTNDSINSISRLIDMGVPKYLVSDALTAVLAQRLVRSICPYCKIEYEPNEKEKTYLKLESKRSLYKGLGCSKCNNTGYKGRTVAFELLNLDKNHRRIITEDNNIDKLREYSYTKGMTNIGEYSRKLVLKGVTTYEEILDIYYS